MSIYRGRTRKEVYLASALYDSIEDRDLGSVKSLLADRGADPNIILPNKGISPFHLAIGCDSNEFATLLTALILQHGGNPNIKSDDGLTPVHIAAAWGRLEILQLLLSCGGDPEVRDINHMTPMHYAHEEKFVDGLKLLRSYLPNKNYAFIKEEEDCSAYDLVLASYPKPIQNFFLSKTPIRQLLCGKECFIKFASKDILKLMFNFYKQFGNIRNCSKILLYPDKILVNNGTSIGEYEVVKKEKPDSIIRKDAEKLDMLPQSNTTEYVMNWFNTHIPLPEPNSTYIKAPKSTGSATECFDSFESSFDESDDPHSKPINPENITFRKVYRKTRKISKDNTPEKKVLSPTIINATDTTNNSYVDAEGYSKLEQYSKESGIMTISSPKTNTPPLNIEKSANLAQNGGAEVGEEKSVNMVKVGNDKSSDYMTCSSCSLPNILERNVFDVTEDVTVNLFTSDESKSVKSNESLVKSEGIGSSDATFVSVSEIYKYEDKQKGIVLYEKRLIKTPSECNGSQKSGSISSKLTSLPETLDYDTDTLRRELTSHGYCPGPITVTTKRVYLRKLRHLKSEPQPPNSDEQAVASKKVYSVELEKTRRDANWLNDIATYKTLEEVLFKQFGNPDPTRKWREGVNKSSFTYLLLDPRVTSNLPCRSETLQLKEIWETFLSAIFYVGKGKRSRPYSHLYDAVNLWKQGTHQSENKKLQHILDIWKDNGGVICLHVFQNIIPVEAYTREAAMINALKLENVRNIKSGDFYGTPATWPQKQKKMLGVYLLHKAMMIFLHEGERQLCPADID